MRQVNFIFYTFDNNTIITGENSNAIDFINKGAAACTINGLTLQTNQSLSLSCHLEESDNSRYTISFAAVGIRELNVIKKFTDGN